MPPVNKSTDSQPGYELKTPAALNFTIDGAVEGPDDGKICIANGSVWKITNADET
jgi:hypothetical protein